MRKEYHLVQRTPTSANYGRCGAPSTAGDVGHQPLVIGRIIQSSVFILAKVLGRANASLNEWRQERERTAQESSKESASGAAATADRTDKNYSPEGRSENAHDAPPQILTPENNGDEKPTDPIIDKPEKPTKLTPEQEVSRHFYTALLLGTVVTRDGSTFDSWEAYRAHLGLILTSGCVLLVASFFPGDGLRGYEFVGGVLLMIMGVLQGRELNRVRIEAIGSAAGQFIAAHTVDENIEILQAMHKLLPIVTKHISPVPGEKEPMQIVTELAEKSGSVGSLKPNRHKKRRR